MKKITLILALFVSIIAEAQQTALPKIDNYTKGELEIKIISFGEKNPITIGKVTADGTIHFNWLKADLSKTNDNDYMTRSIENFYGGKFCRNSNPVITNENAILVETKYIYLFKYGQRVGAIMPSTQIGQEHNKDQLGSTINWIYSDSETSVKATCSEKKEWQDLYSFDQTIAYDLKFKKGFNLVSYTLKENEEWDKGTEKGRLPKTTIIQSVDQIPSNMHWHLKYWANDAYLEIEQQLVKQTPITKAQYENWMPKKIGNLKRTGYEIGKTIERMPTLNNIEFLFEKGDKKATVTIVDCANNKKAADVYTLMLGMASRDWKDKTKTGYNTATKMDDTRVIIEYNETEGKTMLSHNANDRFLIKAEASNINPEELWGILKDLHLEKLIN
jgi:hypothetical protein